MLEPVVVIESQCYSHSLVTLRIADSFDTGLLLEVLLIYVP